jgi:hypothetical protein
MKHRWAARIVVPVLIALMPLALHAQGTQTEQRSERSSQQGGLRQNYPNPFNPETTIPFSVGQSGCSGDSRTYRVTLRIMNILAQVVAVPVVQGGSSGVPGGRQLEKLELPCGDYTAFWDGKDRRGREVSSGVYIYQLEVNGRLIAARRMLVAK